MDSFLAVDHYSYTEKIPVSTSGSFQYLQFNDKVRSANDSSIFHLGEWFVAGWNQKEIFLKQRGDIYAKPCEDDVQSLMLLSRDGLPFAAGDKVSSIKFGKCKIVCLDVNNIFCLISYFNPFRLKGTILGIRPKGCKIPDKLPLKNFRNYHFCKISELKKVRKHKNRRPPTELAMA
jgi:hypothetical protein